jgi:hypothetical protein
MCEIIMLIFGIITLVRGRFLLTRVKEVRGWPARIIGVFLVAPFPISFLAGIVLAAVFLALGKDVESPDFKLSVQIAGFAVVIICFLAAIGIAMTYSEPIRKNRSEKPLTAIPDDYDERFQARARDDSGSQDITGEPSRPSVPPDDRIQH